MESEAGLERRYARTRRTQLAVVGWLVLCVAVRVLVPFARHDDWGVGAPPAFTLDDDYFAGLARWEQARSAMDTRLLWLDWFAQAGGALGLLAAATLGWKLWRLGDAIARAGTLRRMGAAEEPKVDVLGE